MRKNSHSITQNHNFFFFFFFSLEKSLMTFHIKPKFKGNSLCITF
uniref:Uncharacterized protein n=1 Tax=Rhizophora mucronata TaxID=61149 RepID=A0A2P2IIC9_RHIMU